MTKTMTKIMTREMTREMTLRLSTSFLILATLFVGGCESFARMVPPPPSPSFINLSLNSQAGTQALQFADAAMIEPAAGAAVSLGEANSARGKDPFSRRECLSVGFQNGEAVSYNWDESRLGLAFGGHDYGDGRDMGQATMRYTISLQPKKPACN
jgi:hypothetical protein